MRGQIVTSCRFAMSCVTLKEHLVRLETFQRLCCRIGGSDVDAETVRTAVKILTLLQCNLAHACSLACQLILCLLICTSTQPGCLHICRCVRAHVRTRARKHARAHARTHTHTRTHTLMKTFACQLNRKVVCLCYITLNCLQLDSYIMRKFDRSRSWRQLVLE